MAYADFQLESMESTFGLEIRPGPIYPGLVPLPVPGWLSAILDRGRETAALVSEKARSEFLVVPILLAVREVANEGFSIYSGQRLDVDQKMGLVGECDFILARAPALPRLKAPIVTILEAKKGDVEAGMGQCVAQMLGARLFNERSGLESRTVYGCVTSGEVWQFLRLEGSEVVIDPSRLFIDNLGGILAMLREIVGPARDEARPG